jgi:hypothetical protein
MTHWANEKSSWAGLPEAGASGAALLLPAPPAAAAPNTTVLKARLIDANTPDARQVWPRGRCICPAPATCSCGADNAPARTRSATTLEQHCPAAAEDCLAGSLHALVIAACWPVTLACPNVKRSWLMSLLHLDPLRPRPGLLRGDGSTATPCAKEGTARSTNTTGPCWQAIGAACSGCGAAQRPTPRSLTGYSGWAAMMNKSNDGFKPRSTLQ